MKEFVLIDDFISQRSNSGNKRWKSSRNRFTKFLLTQNRDFQQKLDSCDFLTKIDKCTWQNHELWSVKMNRDFFEFKVNPSFDLKKAWSEWRKFLKIFNINPTLNIIK